MTATEGNLLMHIEGLMAEVTALIAHVKQLYASDFLSADDKAMLEDYSRRIQALSGAVKGTVTETPILTE